MRMGAVCAGLPQTRAGLGGYGASLYGRLQLIWGLVGMVGISSRMWGMYTGMDMGAAWAREGHLADILAVYQAPNFSPAKAPVTLQPLAIV